MEEELERQSVPRLPKESPESPGNLRFFSAQAFGPMRIPLLAGRDSTSPSACWTKIRLHAASMIKTESDKMVY